MTYSQEDIKFLKKLNYHLDDSGRYFYSDYKLKGRDYNEISINEFDKKWILFEHREHDVDNDDGYTEDWETFNSLEELKNYLT